MEWCGAQHLALPPPDSGMSPLSGLAKIRSYGVPRSVPETFTLPETNDHRVQGRAGNRGQAPDPISVEARRGDPVACLACGGSAGQSEAEQLAPGLLLEFDAVRSRVRILFGLEVVQTHPKLAKHRVAQLLQLACRTHSSGWGRGGGWRLVFRWDGSSGTGDGVMEQLTGS